MITPPLQTPIAFFVFKRPETTRQVFETISKVRPAKLLLVADGPRPDRNGEAEACSEVRSIISQVDWPCEVSTNFAETNLGCQERIISGLNWVFSLVDEAIILEDDCLPDLSFYFFCQEMLDRYRDDSRIAAISGTNLVQKHLKTDESYFFSQLGGNWGWATWRSEWQHYDRYMKDWPKLRSQNWLSEIFDQPKTAAYWTKIFDTMRATNGSNTWDYQWLYTILKNNTLVIVPAVNLIANIGFGPGATHTDAADARFSPSTSKMEFPLRHPVSFVPLRSIDRHLQTFYFFSIYQRILRRVRHIVRQLRS